MRESHGVRQCLFNRNYAETMRDWNMKGAVPVGSFLLHEHHNESKNYGNCHYWPHYSFRPSVVCVDAILRLGNYDSPNTFFEFDYAKRYYDVGFRSAFFDEIACTHIGKLTSDKSGINAYVLNNVEQGIERNKPKLVHFDLGDLGDIDTILEGDKAEEN